MKKFTDTQKKWALTATMIAALGCSVSFNSQHTANFSADLASNSDELMVPTKVTIGKNDIKVRLVKMNDKETTVLVPPQKDAEGKILFECSDCSSFVITKKLRDDVDTLAEFQDEITKRLTSSSKESTEVVKEASDREETEVASESRSRRNRGDRNDDELDSDRRRKKSSLSKRKQLDLLITDADNSCLTKNNDDRYEGLKQTKCYADAFAKSLKKHEPIDPIVAIKFYRDEIEGDLLADLAKSSVYDEFGMVEENEALELVKRLMEKIPQKQIELHEQLVFTSARALDKKANNVRNTINLSRTQNGGISQAALIKYQDLLATNQILLEANNGALLSKLNPGDANVILQNAYAQPATQIFKSLPQLGNQPQFVNGRLVNVNQIAGVVPAPGSPQTIQNGRVVNGTQYQNQQVYQLQTPNSFGLEELAIPGTIPQDQSQATYQNGMIVAPTAEQVLNGTAQSAIVVLPANTSNGVNFGQPRSLSSQTEQARVNMRAQQAQRIWVQQ